LIRDCLDEADRGQDSFREGRLMNRNTGLLSFGEAEEGSEAGPSKEKERERKKGLTRMDRMFNCLFSGKSLMRSGGGF